MLKHVRTINKVIGFVLEWETIDVCHLEGLPIRYQLPMSVLRFSRVEINKHRRVWERVRSTTYIKNFLSMPNLEIMEPGLIRETILFTVVDWPTAEAYQLYANATSNPGNHLIHIEPLPIGLSNDTHTKEIL
jgi:hypothetical protein